jgi:lipid II:glycine glycyltransferase (peptidoglycan interpeptide bridge formation enzyme)
MNEDDTLRVIDSPNKKDWSKFVYNHPYGNIYQTPEMAEVYKRTKNHDPIVLAVVDDRDEILAILQAVVIKEMSGFLGSFSARSIIQGGPLCVEGTRGLKAVSLLMDEYNKIAKKRALYSEIRNIHNTSQFKALFEKFSYNFEEHLNFLVDLNQSKDQ